MHNSSSFFAKANFSPTVALLLASLVWAAQTASSPQQDAWGVYKATKTQAWDEYKAVVKQAWDHYRAEKNRAWDSYLTLTRQAWNVCRAEIAKAWKDYGLTGAFYVKTKQAKERYDAQKKGAKQTYEAKAKQAKADYYRKEQEAKETYSLKEGQAKQAYYRSEQKGAEPRPRNSTEEVVKQILVQLTPGSEVYGLAEIVAEALDSGPVFLAESWNKKFFLADAMSAPLIEPTWAQTNKAKMIALNIALKNLQRQLEGNNKNVSPENFPKYQELIDRARRI